MESTEVCSLLPEGDHTPALVSLPAWATDTISLAAPERPVHLCRDDLFTCSFPCSAVRLDLCFSLPRHCPAQHLSLLLITVATAVFWIPTMGQACPACMQDARHSCPEARNHRVGSQRRKLFVCKGCPNRAPQTEGLTRDQGVEARSLSSRGPQARFLLRPPPWLADGRLLRNGSHGVPLCPLSPYLLFL